jgi:hypothetical protein
MSNPKTPEVTDRDRRLVEQYLGAFLLVPLKAGPNSAVADNARRAAEAMVAAERERIAKFLERFSYYDQAYIVRNQEDG